MVEMRLAVRSQIRPSPDDQGHTVLSRHLGGDIDDGLLLGRGQRSRLTGRPEHHQPGRAVLEDLVREPLQHAERDRTIKIKGRDQGYEGPVQSHSDSLGPIEHQVQFTLLR